MAPPYLNPTYADPAAGPFRDNAAGAITAGTLRAFAGAIETGIEAGIADVPGGGGLPETPLSIAHGGTAATTAAAARAALGITGVGFTSRGAYNAGTTYSVGDVVSLSGSSYVLGGSSTSTGVSPPGGSWALVAAKGDAASVVYGTTAGTAAQGNDARLSDARTPLDASVTDAKIASTLSPAKITGTAVITTDPRLTDQRTPSNASVTDAKVAAAAGIAISKLAAIPSSTILANGGFASAAPQATTMTDIAAMLDGIIGADQVGVSSAGGLAAPNVQTALQDLYDNLQIALDPVLR